MEKCDKLCYNGVNVNYRGEQMDLGKRLKQARLEAGLSQRQLCGDEITRNMLSQIENGSARPSMDTLRYLAGRLGKPVSYFLDEKTLLPPNQTVMEEARLGYLLKDFARVLKALAEYREPDELFEQERRLLEVLACLALAEEALAAGRRPYAAELLGRAAHVENVYCAGALQRQMLLLKAKVHPKLRQEVVSELPSLDEELLLRARAALDDGELRHAAALLEAAEDQKGADWNYLRGEVYAAQQAYAEAAKCYHKAEEAYPEKTAPRLEHCYRELEEYQMAYDYACKQRI